MANPNTADIRKYLMDAYSDEEIAVFCADYFRDVSDNFAAGLNKGQKIQLLLDHSQRRDAIPNLLAALQKDRPEQYRKRFGEPPRPVPVESVKQEPLGAQPVSQQRATGTIESKAPVRWWRRIPPLALAVFIGFLLLAIGSGGWLILRPPTPTATVTVVPSASVTPPASVVATVTGTLATPTPPVLPSPTFIPALPTPTNTPILPTLPTPRLRQTDTMPMVYVPAGRFYMGINSGEINQQPQHPVDLAAFWIDKFEVSNAQYSKCLEAKKCITPSLFAKDERYNQATQPVVGIYWEDAKNYCEWVGAYLPTEAEWEKAARGTGERLFPWGDYFDPDKLVYNRGESGKAEPVDSFPAGASSYGALNMSGNVEERTTSIYKDYPYKPGDGREKNEEINSTSLLVVRGGSWHDSEYKKVTTTWRSYYTRGTRYPYTGFRCVVR